MLRFIKTALALALYPEQLLNLKNQDYNTMDKHNNIKWTKTRTLHTDDPERSNTRTGARCRH
jgi:hypothetical protein